ncbi:MAG: hypothetical protein Kow00108_23710 [Calditrichia bacterium]
MANKRRKKNTYSAVIQQSKLWIIFIALFLITVFFFTGSHGTFKLIQLEMEKRELQSKKKNLVSETERLELYKDSLKYNTKTIEKIAREKYNMVKPGEKVYQVVPSK